MNSIHSKCNDKEGWTITWHQTCREYDGLTCFACKDPVIRVEHFILKTPDDRQFCFHKSCFYLPGDIDHPLHHHPLTVHRSGRFVCDGCHHVSSGFKYQCNNINCSFKLDFSCASTLNGKKSEQILELRTSYHRHKLKLVYFRRSSPAKFFKDLVCSGCLKTSTDPLYVCSDRCGFFIHKSCLDTLPREFNSLFHPHHPLFLTTDIYNTTCEVCNGEIPGLALRHYSGQMFHISCATRQLTQGLSLTHHEHVMYYVILRHDDWFANTSGRTKCIICNEKCNGAVYKCVKCYVNIHLECIPLPKVVNHESHFHPLKLTNSIVTHRSTDEYHCEICEKVGDINHHSYYCKECDHISHIECVYPEVMSTPSMISYSDPINEDETEKEVDEAEETTEDDELFIANGCSLENDDDLLVAVALSDYNSENEGLPYGESLQYAGHDLDQKMLVIMEKMKGLAFELKTVAHLDQSIESAQTNMQVLASNFEHLRKMFSYYRS